ncbi:hypothetical protein PUN28_001201 [Cardiocondyla obscurior]|uniref:Uncharacterized protein n=1 Tax=Cardiocondyla obscurior TaxID=286306 RepID=A0AAW2H3T6_9HYME
MAVEISGNRWPFQSAKFKDRPYHPISQPSNADECIYTKCFENVSHRYSKLKKKKKNFSKHIYFDLIAFLSFLLKVTLTFIFSPSILRNIIFADHFLLTAFESGRKSREKRIRTLDRGMNFIFYDSIARCS